MDRFETVADESVTKPEFRQMTVEAKYNYASHLFANEIKTDGYNASILYYRPKKDEPKRGEDDLLVSAGYLPDVVIGPDPGMRSVCTAARQYLRPQAPRRPKQRRVRRPRRQKKKNKKRKRNFPKWIRRPKALRLGQRPGREIVSVTTREYRHLAGFNRFRAWNKSQKRKFPEYKKVFDGMPSFKTASYEQYLKRLEYFWQHATYLVQFWKDRPYLKWRFFQKRMARVAVDTLARRIVPTVSRLSCVAYGDWSRRDGIKGHAPSPVKRLKEALRKRATVVSMDEFRRASSVRSAASRFRASSTLLQSSPKTATSPRERRSRAKSFHVIGPRLGSSHATAASCFSVRTRSARRGTGTET